MTPQRTRRNIQIVRDPTIPFTYTQIVRDPFTYTLYLYPFPYRASVRVVASHTRVTERTGASSGVPRLTGPALDKKKYV